jgi:hypothetical protein
LKLVFKRNLKFLPKGIKLVSIRSMNKEIGSGSKLLIDHLRRTGMKALHHIAVVKTTTRTFKFPSYSAYATVVTIRSLWGATGSV